jgi:hypothetical protein
VLSEQEILDTLDNANNGGYYCHFVALGHGYSYLIDCRLNVFRNDHDQWAIAIERLGYNPRAGDILLEIFYYGNCLINLEQYNGQSTNYYMIYPIDREAFHQTIDVEWLQPDARSWLVHGERIALSHNKQDYVEAGIQLKEYEPDTISVEEVGRLLVTQHRHLFRATDRELYKSIPHDLKKILVLDKWYHRDFNEFIRPAISDQQLLQAYALQQASNNQLNMSLEAFTELFRNQETTNTQWNKAQWEDNRPGSYETWQQLARVIATGDIYYYRPSLEPNTHWKNWPDSGSL